ncbi:MAG: MoaD/ThiS family protein [Chloroflexota bacterium]
MKINVRLAGHLSTYGNGKDITVDLEGGSTVSDLIAALRIPSGEVGTLYLDGRGALPDAVLQDGSKVELFPPIAGGC